MRWHNLLLILLVTFTIIPLASSAPPFQSSTSNSGWNLQSQLIEAHEQNVVHVFVAHIFNQSNGVPITSGASCYYHLYNPDGQHIAQITTSSPSDQFDYTFAPNSNNFTQLGEYAFFIQCNSSSQGGALAETFQITPTGGMITTPTVLTYIFFLLICLTILVFSARLTMNNPIQEDELSQQKLYETKKRSEWKFYLQLLKRKMWIVGLFGIYLSLLIFTTILNQLVYIMGLLDVSKILINVNIVLMWGLIPFTLFWLVYIIIFILKSTTDTMRYQFGGLGNTSRK